MAPASERPEVSVEVRIEGDHDVVTAGRWQFTVWHDLGDGEPRVLDTDAATALGFERPRKVRETIERIWPDGQRPIQRPTVGRRNVRGGGTQKYTTDAYYLTEAELLKLCARCETPVADAILDEMIATYMAVRRRLLTPPAPPAPPAPPGGPALPSPDAPEVTEALTEPLMLGGARLRRVLLVAVTASDEATLPSRASSLDAGELRGAIESLRRVLAFAAEVGQAADAILHAPESARAVVAASLVEQLLGPAEGRRHTELAGEWTASLALFTVFSESPGRIGDLLSRTDKVGLSELRNSAAAPHLASTIRVLEACLRAATKGANARPASRALARIR